MKKVIVFLLVFLGVLICLLVGELSDSMPRWASDNRLWILTTLTGRFGGALYCMRGVYLNACVRKHWEVDWEPWCYIRPFASLICGGVSYLFLKAGLLVLEAGEKTNASHLGFYAFAFVADLNVDKFVSRVEDIAQATWELKNRAPGKRRERPKN